MTKIQVKPSSGKQSPRDRLQTLYVINDMLKQVEADGLDIQIILPRVLKVAAVELEAATGSIIIANENLEIEHAWVLAADQGYEVNYTRFLRSILEQGLAGAVFNSQRTMRVANTEDSDLWIQRADEQQHVGPHSAICVPLVARQQSIGVVTLTRPGIDRFDEDDEELLKAIVDQAAITIENARLYEEAQYQLKVTQLLNRAGQVVNSSLNLHEIMQSLLAQMNELFNAHALSIALATPDRQALVFEVAEGEGRDGIVGMRIPADRGITGSVLTTGKPALVNDATHDERFSQIGDRRSGTKTEAMICAPLRAHGTVIGTIQVLNPHEGSFNHSDLELLVNLANLAGTAFANAQQYTLTQAAEARYTSLFDDSIDPIVLTNLSGRIIATNHRATEMLSYSSAELIGQSIDLLHNSTFTTNLDQFINLNGSFGKLNTHIVIKDRHVIAKDGKRTPVEIHAKPTLMYDDRVVQWIYHDITQQVELEAMRRDLTAMLYHDLQNPLTNIIASLELLELEMAETLDPISTTMLDVAVRSSQRLRHLIRSLLDINQIEAGLPVTERQAVAVDSIIDYTNSMMSPQFNRRHIDFVATAEPDIPAVFANEDMIQRVLINLTDNAFKYSRPGQTVTLAARQVATHPNHVLITVSDQGPGIPKQHRQAVFDKFFRTPDNPIKGIGLGLSFCRLAVEAHGGQIWVSQAPGGGAQFNLTLPHAQS